MTYISHFVNRQKNPAEFGGITGLFFGGGLELCLSSLLYFLRDGLYLSCGGKRHSGKNGTHKLIYKNGKEGYVTDKGSLLT